MGEGDNIEIIVIVILKKTYHMIFILSTVHPFKFSSMSFFTNTEKSTNPFTTNKTHSMYMYLT